jgi:hypothetical protein
VGSGGYPPNADHAGSGKQGEVAHSQFAAQLRGVRGNRIGWSRCDLGNWMTLLPGQVPALGATIRQGFAETESFLFPYQA